MRNALLVNYFDIICLLSKVVYNAKELFRSNDDIIVDDVIRIFSKQVSEHVVHTTHRCSSINDPNTTVFRRCSSSLVFYFLFLIIKDNFWILLALCFWLCNSFICNRPETNVKSKEG